VNDQFSVLVLADIHGNVEALRAVLEDARRHSADEIVAAGDLLSGGPRPTEVVDLLWEAEANCVQGNADLSLLEERDDVNKKWTNDRIGEKGLEFLKALLFSYRVTAPGAKSPEDDLLVVHATPTSSSSILTVEPDAHGYLEITPEAEAKQLLGDAEANLIVSGHVHYASIGTPCGQRFASIGSVGFPGDGDTRAAYAVAQWDGRSWELTHHRVAYDHLNVVAELEAVDAPFSELNTRRLREARLYLDDAG
jgi:hypothetical protein